ncbi:hypothetical protein ACD661_01080 [Legionella lytica]|uniref:Uncharacterized protein n=1 Tax=Legionella lytica TaxID=96232 RepID=A0ABW8D366_9GAMM
MHPIFDRINSLTLNEQQLNLAESDLYQLSQEELLLLFAAVPEHISHLNLGWNYAKHKSNEELITLFQAIPQTVTHINLSGHSLHLIKDFRQLMALLKIFPYYVSITTENNQFNQLLNVLQLIKTVKEDAKQNTLFPLPQQTQKFLSAFTKTERQQLIQIIEEHLEQFDEITAFDEQSDRPWATLCCAFLLRDNTDCLTWETAELSNEELMEQEQECHRMLDYFQQMRPIDDLNALGESFDFLIHASTPFPSIKERLELVPRQVHEQFIPTIGKFANDSLLSLANFQPQWIKLQSFLRPAPLSSAQLALLALKTQFPFKPTRPVGLEPQTLAMPPRIDAALATLQIPNPWHYEIVSLANKKLFRLNSGEKREEYTASETPYLQVHSNELPITPTPPGFMLVEGFEFNQEKKQTLFYFAFAEDSTPTHPPKTLAMILEEGPKPTTTQLIDLITKIAADVDWLSPGLVFYPSVKTIYITNAQALGTNLPLSFKFCPSALKMREELPNTIPRHLIHQRMTAVLALQLALQTTNLQTPECAQKMLAARSQSPALLALFSELWNANQQPDAKTQSMRQLAPTLDALNKIRIRTPQTWSINHLPGLLSGAACNHSATLSSVAAEALLQLLAETNPPQKNKQTILESLANSIELVMPQEHSALSDPSSVSKSMPWMNRMNLLVQVLEYMEKQGDYERLHTLQQRLLAADINQNLGGNLPGYQGKFALAVLIPVVKLSVWMSFQFETLRARYIFDRNTRKMATMLYDYLKKKPELEAEMQRYVAMMLVMSDFGAWIGQDPMETTLDAQLQISWDRIDLQTFLDYVIPCCRPTLSFTTTERITQKLAQHSTLLIQKSAQEKLSVLEEKQLHAALQYLKNIAWNGHLQEQHTSFQSRYTGHLLAQLFAVPQQTLFTQAMQNSSNELPLRTHSLDELFTLLNNQTMETPCLRQQRKIPLSLRQLTTINYPLYIPDQTTRYTPKPAQAGAPLDINHFKFNLPENNGHAYHRDTQSISFSSIRSLTVAELQQNKITFTPTTLSTVHRVCTVVDTQEGTQGAWQATLANGGENRKVFFGISWDKQQDSEQSIPGTTTSSIALDAATGTIYYRDPITKEQKEYPYTIPMHAGSNVIIGISGRQVYFVVDGHFFPPIPDLLLPVGADIHPLIRIGCPAIKLNTRVMGAKWTVERHPAGRLVYADTNPIAHELYLADLRLKVCPHHHAQLLNQQRIELIPEFSELLNNPELIAAQDLNTQFNLFMVLLAKQHCTGETCAAPAFLRTVISDIFTIPIQDDGPGLDDLITPARVIELAQILGLKELASMLEHKATQANTRPSLQGFFGLNSSTSLQETASPSEDSEQKPSSSISPR